MRTSMIITDSFDYTYDTDIIVRADYEVNVQIKKTASLSLEKITPGQDRTGDLQRVKLTS